MLVLVITFFKEVLLIHTYVFNENAKNCNVSLYNASISNHTDYIFTLVIYGSGGFLRLIEYCILGISICKWSPTEESTPSPFNNCCQRKLFWITCTIIFFVHIVLGIAILVLGVKQQKDYSRHFSDCTSNRPWIYYIYSALNGICHIYDFIVRILFVYVSSRVYNLWLVKSPSNEDREDDTNIECSEEITSWFTVCKDFKIRLEKYHTTGAKAKKFNEHFQAWFILPWIIYNLISSVNTMNALRPWTLEKNQPPLLSISYYILNNISSFITLLLPLFCAKRANRSHHEYYKHMRKSQMKKYSNKSEKQLFYAKQLYIQKEEDFDFVPHVGWTNITIEVDSSLYFILLLSGIFFTIVNSIFYHN